MADLLFAGSGITWICSFASLILLILLKRGKKERGFWYYQIVINLSVFLLFTLVMIFRLFNNYIFPTLPLTTLSTGVYLLIAIIFLIDSVDRWKNLK